MRLAAIATQENGRQALRVLAQSPHQIHRPHHFHTPQWSSKNVDALPMRLRTELSLLQAALSLYKKQASKQAEAWHEYTAIY